MKLVLQKQYMLEDWCNYEVDEQVGQDRGDRVWVQLVNYMNSRLDHAHALAGVIGNVLVLRREIRK